MFKARTFEEHARHRMEKKAARLAWWSRRVGPSKTRTTPELLSDMKPRTEIKAALLGMGIIGVVVFLVCATSGPLSAPFFLAAFGFAGAVGIVTALVVRIARLWQENRSLDAEGMMKFNEFLRLFPDFLPMVIRASSPEGLVSNRMAAFVFDATRKTRKSSERDVRLLAISARLNHNRPPLTKTGLVWYVRLASVWLKSSEKRLERQRASQAARNTALGMLIRETRKVESDRIVLESVLPSASAPVVSRRL
jgi:hypothetical protein